MASPVNRGSPAASWSPLDDDLAFGGEDAVEQVEDLVDLDAEKWAEIIDALNRAISTGQHWSNFYELVGKYRFHFNDWQSFEGILRNALLHAKTAYDFDLIRRISLAEQMLNPESLMARILQAMSYFDQSNDLMAAQILKDKQLEIGRELGGYVIEFKDNSLVTVKFLNLLAFLTNPKGSCSNKQSTGLRC